MRTTLVRGTYEVALARIAERSDADLFELFHSRGSLNVTGISDAILDASLEAYRRASDRAGRVAAKAKVAARLSQIRPVSVLWAPTVVFLVSQRLTGLTFVDDLPELGELGLLAGLPGGVWPDE
jgi:hypothetical protein